MVSRTPHTINHPSAIAMLRDNAYVIYPGREQSIKQYAKPDISPI